MKVFNVVGRKMARNGLKMVIYKGTFVSNQSLSFISAPWMFFFRILRETSSDLNIGMHRVVILRRPQKYDEVFLLVWHLLK